MGTTRWPRRCGISTWSARVRGRSRTCSTSISTSCTRSPARRRSTGSASPAAPSAGRTSPSPPKTTTSPRSDVLAPIADPVSRTQVETLRKNCAEFGVPLYPMNHAEQGIVHVVGPQLGLTQPGLTVVCGDSHTSTHGAFGAMAFGIGTSEVEHVLATQTLPLKPFKTMAINVNSNTRPAAPRRHEQGRHPRDHRQDRHRRRPGLRAGVPGQRHREPLDGGPDDDLQHVDRGRRPRRHDRPGRDDLRLPEGPRPRAEGRRLGRRRRGVARAAQRRRRGVRRRGRHRRRHADPVRHLGHQPGPGPAAVRPGAGPRGDRRRERARRRRAGAGVHGPARPARRCATSTSTPSSSAPAPTAGSKTCGRSPRS